MAKQDLQKEYQLWIYMDGGYQLTEYDYLEEVLLAEKHSCDWYVTKRVDYSVREQ